MQTTQENNSELILPPIKDHNLQDSSIIEHEINIVPNILSMHALESPKFNNVEVEIQEDSNDEEPELVQIGAESFDATESF